MMEQSPIQCLAACSLSRNESFLSCVYLCSGNHQVIAPNPELLKVVQETGIKIPFTLFHKSGMTKELFIIFQAVPRLGCVYRTSRTRF